MRVINRFANACRRVSRSRIRTVEDAVGGVEPEPLLQESILCMVAQKVHQVTSLPPSHLLLSSAKELHQLLLVAARL